MTAISGVWRFDGRPDAAEACGRMLASQRIYGPHAGSQWSAGNVALGRQLMRVLPEDAFDSQPAIGGAGRYVLVADIRLDNRDELLKSLSIPGPQACSLSDAGVLLATIERWNESWLERIIGDYAIALWDTARRSLLLVRDPLGQRPLHYHRGSSFFAFASMPKGLHALPEVPYLLDEDRIAQLLVLMLETGTQSFFCGIERVEPGHVVTVTEGGVNSRLYWQPGRRPIVLRRPDEYCEALRDQLDQAVRCRLRGTQDVGSQLSGGLDSSAVAATAARLLAPSGRRVIAFTAVPREGYDGPAPRNAIVDEGTYAAATAALYPNMEHVLVRTKGGSLLDELDRNFYLFDQPSLNIYSSSVGDSICEAARDRKLTVLLTGLMGNLGLSYDGLTLLSELISSGRWLQWWREARHLVAHGGMRWRGVLARTFGPWCPPAIWVALHRLAHGRGWEADNHTAINKSRFVELNLAARARERELDLVYRPWKDGFAERLWAIRRVDLGNSYKGALAGWHIDLRDPTADVRLLEYCLAVPTTQFLSNGKRRALARYALTDRLPSLVLENSRHGMQVADWHERLNAERQQVAAELKRLDSCPAASRALDLPRLHRLVENWPAGGWERSDITRCYRLALLRGISIGHFVRRASGSN